jgi:hypothetical protein
MLAKTIQIIAASTWTIPSALILWLVGIWDKLISRSRGAAWDKLKLCCVRAIGRHAIQGAAAIGKDDANFKNYLTLQAKVDESGFIDRVVKGPNLIPAIFAIDDLDADAVA